MSDGTVSGLATKGNGEADGHGDGLILVDGSAYVFRAYYAIPPLTTKAGLLVNAAYGFTLMLLKTLRQNPGRQVVVAMDLDSREFRRTIDPQYKANRAPAPDDLKAQFPVVKEILQAFSVPIAELSGYEADDVIATLTRQALAQGRGVTVITGDKDLMQLVSDRVRVWDPMKERRYDAAAVQEKWGVRPDQIRDYLALVGDASDNVPGVPKIGPKTAAQLISRFGSVAAMYGDLDAVAGSGIRGSKGIAQTLRECREQVDRALKLVSLQDGLPLSLEEDRFQRREPDREVLRRKLEELEFHKLVADLSLDLPPGEGGAKKPAPRERSVKLVLDEACLHEALKTVRASGGMALLPVFDGENPRKDPLLGLGMGTLDGETLFYAPTGHRYLGAPRQISEGALASEVGPLLEDVSLAKAVHRLKGVHLWLDRWGCRLEGAVDDVELLDYLRTADLTDHGLDAMAMEFCGRHLPPSPWTRARKAGEAPVEIGPVAAWCASSLASMAEIRRRLLGDLLPEEVKLYRDLEAPTARALAGMESAGIAVDGATLARLSRDLDEDVADLERRAVESAGVDFNLNSNQQLGEVLFQRLNLPVVKKGKTGPSVDQEVLETLSMEHPLPALILERRSLIKLKNTYLDVLPSLAESDGRVHTSFHQTVTATGRLSSSDPNLQNIPVRTELGRKVREAFVAPPGHFLLSADYSQIELRVLAHVTGDDAMVGDFLSGEDVHRRTASEIFGVPSSDVTDQMRRSAKTINFGIIYGLSAFGLAKRLGIRPKEAQEMIDRYFLRYAGVRRWIDQTIQKAREEGVVRTLWGRRRRIPELASQNHAIRQGGERMAVNTPIQGTAADLMKRAMVGVAEGLVAGGFRSRLLLQVHDELILEVPEAEAGAVTEMVVAAMKGAATLRVPLEVGVGVGRNWAEAH